jgi:predicted neuraminidase
VDTLADGGPTDEFSYPAMAWADGSLWLTYTVDRERLAWQRYE